MNAITAPDTATTSTRAAAPTGVWRIGLVATVLAAAATATVAAIASAAGVPLTMDGEELPIAGFATLTTFFSVVGVVLAWAMGRWAPRPRSTFVATTVVLTLVSFLPSIASDASTATRVVLCIAHAVAASIVIPLLASRLPDRRPAR
ncbi:MAG TPA: DUF6069 family protein [Acidimicrobiales bacterium]